MKFVKLDENATLPVRGSRGSAGYDLVALKDGTVWAGEQALIRTGIGWEDIPGYVVGIIKPRSGLAFKKRLDVRAGVIDSDYADEIKVLLVNEGNQPFFYKAGDRIAQLVMTPCYCMSNDEAKSARNGGFGSTGVAA